MPYSVEVALRRLKPLIRWTAWHFASRRNFQIPFEDLEAEGFLKLVECCRSFPDGQTRFVRYFKRSWYNHLKDLHRRFYTDKRQGKEVGLVNAENLAIQPEGIDYRELLRNRFDELSPLLSQDAKRLLHALLYEPPPEVYEVAWKDFCRKNKLRSLGQPVVGAKKYRVRLKHIRQVLGLSGTRVREIVREVRFASKSQTRR